MKILFYPAVNVTSKLDGLCSGVLLAFWLGGGGGGVVGGGGGGHMWPYFTAVNFHAP